MYRVAIPAPQTNTNQPYQTRGGGSSQSFQNFPSHEQPSHQLRLMKRNTLISRKCRKFNFCNSNRKLLKQIHMYINCILIKMSKNRRFSVDFPIFRKLSENSARIFRKIIAHEFHQQHFSEFYNFPKFSGN